MIMIKVSFQVAFDVNVMIKDNEFSLNFVKNSLWMLNDIIKLLSLTNYAAYKIYYT